MTTILSPLSSTNNFPVRIHTYIHKRFYTLLMVPFRTHLSNMNVDRKGMVLKKPSDGQKINTAKENLKIFYCLLVFFWRIYSSTDLPMDSQVHSCHSLLYVIYIYICINTEEKRREIRVWFSCNDLEDSFHQNEVWYNLGWHQKEFWKSWGICREILLLHAVQVQYNNKSMDFIHFVVHRMYLHNLVYIWLIRACWGRYVPLASHDHRSEWQSLFWWCISCDHSFPTWLPF